MVVKSNADDKNATERDLVHPLDDKQKARMAELANLEDIANKSNEE
jgi:hypothetical protein